MLDFLFARDMVLDQERLNAASKQFTKLSDDMKDLRKDIDKLLEELSVGYNTTAGRKFIEVCRKDLLDPMNDQADVIQHVAENLLLARNCYKSVFTEYESINRFIRQVSDK